MIYTVQTKRAIKLCYDAHAGQVDKSGLPYVHHPLHLAEQMDDELSTIVALLHDVIEDTEYTFEDLECMGFGNDTIEALRLLTHDADVPYLDYVKKIADNPTARKVKLADLAHNSDITRLDHEPTEKDLKRLEKYREARRILLETSPGSSDKIDISFDFRSDTPEEKDPDSYSRTLRSYHQKLWSKPLPNGEVMDLRKGAAPYYLKWKDFDFGSDSIIVEMRYGKNKKIIDQVYEIVGDYETYFENLVQRSYTIGGMIIFPKHRNSMNQQRGMNSLIADRWDLTLECIRRFYEGEDSPLYKTLQSDKEFYDLFVNFKGYVDFFFLQDCVSDDYSKVDIWIGDASFRKSGLPETVDEYFEFIRKEHEFLDKRNKRISDYCGEHDI